MAEDEVKVSIIADARQAIADVAQFTGRLVALTNQLAESAHAHQEAIDAANQLGHAYDAVSRATSGVVSVQQAFRTQQQLNEAGMNVSAEGLAVITRRAREYANATQVDLQTALDRVTSSIIGGSSRALHQLGANIDHNTRGSRASASALQQWAEQQRRTLPETQNLSEAARSNAQAWTDFGNAMAAGAAQAINLRARLNELREASGGVREFVGNVLGALGIGAGGPEAQRRNTERQMEQLRAGIAETVARRGGGRIAGLDRMSTAQLYALREQIDRGAAGSFAGAVSAASRTGQGLVDSSRPPTTAPPLITGGDTGGGGGGTSTADQWTQIGAELAAIGEAGRDLDLDFDADTARHPRESLARYLARLQRLHAAAGGAAEQARAARDRMRADREARRTRSDEAARQQSEATARQIEGARVRGAFSTQQGMLGAQFGQLGASEQYQLREQRRATGQDVTAEGIRAVRAANDVDTQLRNTFTRTQTFAQNVAGAVGGAFESMTSAFASHVEALTSGRESLAQAGLGIVHDAAMQIGMQSLPKAIFELASGVAAQAATLGVPNPISAMHFASAGMFAGLAAGGLAIGGLTGLAQSAISGPASAGGGDAGARVPASTSAAGGGGPGAMVVQVNFNGAPMHTREDIQGAVAMGANIARTRGFTYDGEIMQRRRDAT